MSRSTRLVSAVNILAIVASNRTERVTTDLVSELINDHPTRVRQLVSALVKAGFIDSTRGATGGITLKRPADRINLDQVYAALEAGPAISFAIENSRAKWKGSADLLRQMTRVEKRLNKLVREEMKHTTLADIVKSLKVPS